MHHPIALPDELGLRLDDFVLTPTTAVALLASVASSVACPRCGTPSDRLHSHYRRTVADLPCADRTVVLRLLVRRFRCCNASCPQVIFAERLPGLVDAHARSTRRLTDAHRALGLALGGEAGSRLATQLDMPTSPDTVLRRVKATPEEPAPAPRYVGVDDWAIRKGQRYGTILIDLERGRVLDLLPGRDGEALKTWLKEHPGVEVITRDRWAAFAQAATEAAPQAQQVADRWHLLKNLREALEKFLERMSGAVEAALVEKPTDPAGEPDAEAATTGKGDGAEPTGPVPSVGIASPSAATAQAPEASAANRPRPQRVQRFERVHALRATGHSLRQIARATGLSPKTVIHYLRCAQCPDWKPGQPRPTQLDRFASFIEGWISQGGRNAAELYRELQQQGSDASYDAVRRYLARRIGSPARPGPRVGPVPVPAPQPPSARKLSFELIRRPEARKEEEKQRLERLRAGDADLREGLDLAAELAALLRKQRTGTLADWLASVERSNCRELQSLAEGLRQDEAAVQAALTASWSNGAVEGQVNRLKVIKRQMYGRAGMELLRARVKHAA